MIDVEKRFNKMFAIVIGLISCFILGITLIDTVSNEVSARNNRIDHINRMGRECDSLGGLLFSRVGGLYNNWMVCVKRETYLGHGVIDMPSDTQVQNKK